MEGELLIREIDWSSDKAALSRIDTSFEVSQILELAGEGHAFSFELRSQSPSREKTYAFAVDADKLASASIAIAAVVESAPIGYAIARMEEWNRRLVVSDFFVDREFRGRGIGSALFEELQKRIPSGTRQVFVETQDTNVPGIHFYQRLGFTICGFDSGLYDGELQNETAVFLSLPIR